MTRRQHPGEQCGVHRAQPAGELRTTYPVIILLELGRSRGSGGHPVGPNAAIFAMTTAPRSPAARIVEQNLMTVDRVVEAAWSTGVSRKNTITTVVLPEALGPLGAGATPSWSSASRTCPRWRGDRCRWLGDFALRLATSASTTRSRGPR
ncbi:hypothetical protein QJS66_06770 [Kocuria rhizophila]|nr:hypothetical protein QJS66_06770 [Kocuria rhizophila]